MTEEQYLEELEMLEKDPVFLAELMALDEEEEKIHNKTT